VSTRSKEDGFGIQFNHVGFSYAEGVQVLQNISFKITPGMFCGIVGHSGAGKTTILHLLQRIYEPSCGSISVDGRDMTDWNIKSYRSDIAVVPQGYTLFDGSIRFNVSLGSHPNHEATDSDVEEACKMANMHDTIMALPEKYNTECGPQGSRLSGGQRQRLAIARALIRKPKLLLLDESTSALDGESEQALQSSLIGNARGMTVVAISHRIHTLERADIILVMDKGMLIDSGTHGELLVNCEVYRESAMRQAVA
jgi:ABC-type multidrug transport system fused ATPase/permease subunit